MTFCFASAVVTIGQLVAPSPSLSQNNTREISPKYDPPTLNVDGLRYVMEEDSVTPIPTTAGLFALVESDRTRALLREEYQDGKRAC